MYWRVLMTLTRRPASVQLRSWVPQRPYSSKNGEEKTIPKTSKPLRILFCGSDAFSSASLRALHNEQKRDSTLIASIDVLCRPGKPSGRSLKKIREGIKLENVSLSLANVFQCQSKPLHKNSAFQYMRETVSQDGM